MLEDKFAPHPGPNVAMSSRNQAEMPKHFILKSVTRFFPKTEDNKESHNATFSIGEVLAMKGFVFKISDIHGDTLVLKVVSR